MTDSFSTLFSRSWQFFRSNFTTIIVGAVVFGLLSFGAQKLLETNAIGTMENRFGDLDRIEELSKRVEEGDEEAFQEMMMQLGVMGDEGQMDNEAVENVAMGMMQGLLPSFVLFFIVMSILGLVISTYYTVLAIEGGSVGATFARVPGLLLPMLGVWIWAFLRSFIWIPVIGIIFAIIIGPRLIFSTFILVREKKGVMTSVKLSYDRTRGYWGKIVGNMLLMCVAVWLIMFVLLIGAGVLSLVHAVVATIAMSILQQLTSAFGNIFMVRLGDTVMANPVQAPEKK